MKVSNVSTVLALTSRESEILQDVLEAHHEHLTSRIEDEIDNPSRNETDYQQLVDETCAVENILQYLGVEGYEFT